MKSKLHHARNGTSRKIARTGLRIVLVLTVLLCFVHLKFSETNLKAQTRRGNWKKLGTWNKRNRIDSLNLPDHHDDPREDDMDAENQETGNLDVASSILLSETMGTEERVTTTKSETIGNAQNSMRGSDRMEVAKQSTSTDASFDSELYRRNLQKVHELAEANGCDLGHPLYKQIEESLAPFEAEGISDAMILRASRECSDNVLLEIKNGTIVSKTPKIRISHNRGRMEDVIDTFEEILKFLPDMKFVINLMDEPCGWTAPIPEEDERALQDGSRSMRDVWKQYACNSVGYESLQNLHGFFVNPDNVPGIRANVPIWSIYSWPQCFSDIMSSAIHTPGPTSLHCPPESMKPFLERKMTAIFRGTTTGGSARKYTKEEDIEKFHRLRLVEAAKALNRSDIDVGITAHIQCDSEQCKKMKDRYGQVPRMRQDDIFEYAMQIVVDGNGAANRQGPTMCSGAIMLKAIGLHEWYYSGLRPWKEYLPLDLTFDNLGTLVDWVHEHLDEADEIAKNAAKFSERYLRTREQQCYAAKLAAEYARLYEKWEVGSIH